MDFGVTRFLEMFEERFGRVATTVLLALIGSAIALWALDIIVDHGTKLYETLISPLPITKERIDEFKRYFQIFIYWISVMFISIGAFQIAKLILKIRWQSNQDMLRWIRNNMEAVIRRDELFSKETIEVLLKARDLMSNDLDRAAASVPTNPPIATPPSQEPLASPEEK